MLNLGCMNGWYEKPPKEFTKCRKLKHKVDRKNLGNCYNEFTCTTCKIKYQVDSSG